MSATQSSENTNLPPEYHTDLPVGEILRRTRVHYNQTLQDVAGYMRIRSGQLDAIEKGEVEKLPGRVYAIGYVRTYSEYLGLDGEKMVQLFKQQSLNRTLRPELHFPVAASESKAPNLFIIFASLIALALILGAWLVMSNKGAQDAMNLSDIPDVPAAMRVSAGTPTAVTGGGVPLPVNPEGPAPDSTAAAPAIESPQLPAPNAVVTAPPAAIQPEQPPQAVADIPADPGMAETAETVAEDSVEPAAAENIRQIVMTVRERSWVEVRDKQNKAILSRILKPGEVFIVPEENYGLRLDTGNAGGLELTVNGQLIPPLGKSGDILRGMVLDGNQLLNKAAASQ